MSRFIDITGQRYGRWMVLRFIKRENHNSYYECVCVCGTVKIISSNSLRTGNSLSCGCLRIERTINANKRHGLTKTAEFRSWIHMKGRCYNPRNAKYHVYGARGIKVCDRWMESFDNFLKDMGNRPTTKHSLDRIDVNKGYFPDNCRWATWEEQANNKQDSRWIEYNGETLTVSQWSKRTGIKPATLLFRLNSGWSIKDSLCRPVMIGNNQTTKWQQL